jgi:hypothetical protein
MQLVFSNPPPKVVTLCGSTRFREQFEMANAQLTLAGYIVLSVGFFHHREGSHSAECQSTARPGVARPCNCGQRGISPAQKGMLDMLHLEKIRMSYGIYVLNVAGYVGASTTREVAFAITMGRKVAFLEEKLGASWMEQSAHALGAMVAEFARGNLPELPCAH